MLPLLLLEISRCLISSITSLWEMRVKLNVVELSKLEQIFKMLGWVWYLQIALRIGSWIDSISGVAGHWGEYLKGKAHQAS